VQEILGRGERLDPAPGRPKEALERLANGFVVVDDGDDRLAAHHKHDGSAPVPIRPVTPWYIYTFV
jgi:hypothetical protein